MVKRKNDHKSARIEVRVAKKGDHTKRGQGTKAVARMAYVDEGVVKKKRGTKGQKIMKEGRHGQKKKQEAGNPKKQA